MPTQEYNFNDSQLSVISGSTLSYNFNELYGDYIKVTVFDTNNNFITEGTSKTGDVVIYRDDLDDIYIKPNELLNSSVVPNGNYKLQIDFLRNVFSDIYTEPVNLILNSEFDIAEGSTKPTHWSRYSNCGNPANDFDFTFSTIQEVNPIGLNSSVTTITNPGSDCSAQFYQPLVS